MGGQLGLESGPELVITDNAAKRTGQTEPCQRDRGVRRRTAGPRDEALRRFQGRRPIRDDEVDENLSHREYLTGVRLLTGAHRLDGGRPSCTRIRLATDLVDLTHAFELLQDRAQLANALDFDRGIQRHSAVVMRRGENADDIDAFVC